MIPIIVFVILSLMANPALGSTTARKLWNPLGVPISIATGNQVRSAGISDGNGGAIIIWEDINRYPDDFYPGLHLYGQRINAKGECLWEAEGTPLITVSPFAQQGNVAIISDGAGGAIFTFEDNRYFQGYIFAQRIDGSGKEQWQEDGIPICTAMSDNGGLNSDHAPQITSDGKGGAIIAWYEGRDGYHLSVYAQRVKADGTTLWALNGVPVVKGPFYAFSPKIVGDGKGGAIITWLDSRKEDGYHIFAQRLDGNGAPQWIVNGIEVSPQTGGPDQNCLVSDGSGGAIITWANYLSPSSSETDIYAQKINSDCQFQWQANGVPICARSGTQQYPAMVGDGAGGAIITWEDPGATPEGSGQQFIYAQRVSANGITLWAENGIPIYTKTQGFGPSIVSDGNQGAIIVWDGFPVEDGNPKGPTIVAQIVRGSGQTLWGANGFEIYNQPMGSYGFSPKILSDGTGGAIIRWTDYRNPVTAMDIYTQRVANIGSNAWIYLLLLD
jgi:hypothetical protein